MIFLRRPMPRIQRAERRVGGGAPGGVSLAAGAVRGA
jgi:hypothetical protein